MIDRTVIVGAGMSGLACARALRQAGHAPLVLDKGRNSVGGRMATRRVASDAGEMRFDHGAQYFTARTEAFAAFLDEMTDAVALWDDGVAHAHHVGRPGMAGLCRAMADGIEIRQGVVVTALDRGEAGWHVIMDDDRLTAARVVLTVPAPQVAGLIGADHPLAAPLEAVSMAPCLTLMAAFPAASPRPFVCRKSAEGTLAWIAQDSTKPGRPDRMTTWVAQAEPDWSARHLDEDHETIAAKMLPLLCAQIGTEPADALYAAAHRWGYARVTEPLGQTFLRDDAGSLYLGGDWCLGARVEAAWQSGTAIAHDILEQADAG